MVTIEKKKCLGCGACVADCVAHNLTLEDGVASVKGECMLCGHCVAICPAFAAAIPEYAMEEVEEWQEGAFAVPADNLLRAIKFRRSVRDFQEKTIEPEKLKRILQAGQYTETAVNRQDVRFIVLQNELPKAKALIWEGWKRFALELEKAGDPRADAFMKHYRIYQEDAARDRLFFNAPAVILVAADVPLDGGLAAANMEAVAVAEGLGVLFDGYVVYAIEHSPEAREWLELGEKRLVACMLLGYPGVAYRRTAPRREADIVWK